MTSSVSLEVLRRGGFALEQLRSNDCSLLVEVLVKQENVVVQRKLKRFFRKCDREISKELEVLEVERFAVEEL